MQSRKWFLFFLLLQVCLPAVAQKTDVVILSNGDRVTGEIVKLEAGLLEFKTDTMGRVNIEWRFISEVISDKTQTLETIDGDRWLGALAKPKEGDNIQVNTVRGPVELEPENVITAWPVKATFWDKIDLDVSAGIDFTKSTEILNTNISVDFLHRTDDRLTEASLRSDVTAQSKGEDQSRQEVRFSHEYLLPERRFRSWNVGLDSNNALGVDLRVFTGASFGKYLQKTNHVWFTVAGGLNASEERPTDGERIASLEAVGTVRYRYFRYATPERSFDTTFSLFPSLTESGRVRSDLRTTFKLELVRDLFWTMELYATSDNKPLTEGAEEFDYGLTTGLGWSF